MGWNPLSWEWRDAYNRASDSLPGGYGRAYKRGTREAAGAAESNMIGHMEALGAKKAEAIAAAEAQEALRYIERGGHLGAAKRGLGWVKGNTLDVPGNALKKGGKWLAIGGAVAGGAYLLANAGFFGGEKKDAKLDVENEGLVRDNAMAMDMSPALPAPGQETMMGIPAQPGAMAMKVRPDGPLTALNRDKGANEPHYALPA